MQGEWISGAELLIRWTIKEGQLFDYVKEGLKPYDEFGNLKLSPDGIKKTEKMRQDLRHFKANKSRYSSGEISAEEFASREANFNKKKSDFNNTDYSWAVYELPPYDMKAAKSALKKLVDSLFLIEDVMEHPREQEVTEYLKRYENYEAKKNNEYPVEHPGDQVVNEDTDNTKVIKEQKSNEQNVENKFIWNGRSWKIIFQGRVIDDNFAFIGFKTIAYILELKGESIFPLELMKVVRPPINDSDLPHFKQGVAEYKYKYCKNLGEELDELYKDPSDAKKYREFKEANRDEFKIILKNGTHTCIPWLRLQGGNDKDHKKAKNALEGSINNAIKSLNKNNSCKDLAFHLSDKVKYWPTHKGFLYSGDLVWDIDHGS